MPNKCIYLVLINNNIIHENLQNTKTIHRDLRDVGTA